jgi:aconitase B
MRKERHTRKTAWKKNKEIFERGKTNTQKIIGRTIGVSTIKLRDTLSTTEDKLTIIGHPTTKATHSVTWVRIITVELRVVQQTGDNGTHKY